MSNFISSMKFWRVRSNLHVKLHQLDHRARPGLDVVPSRVERETLANNRDLQPDRRERDVTDERQRELSQRERGKGKERERDRYINRVVCGVWCVVCGVWCVVCGVW